MEKIKSLIFLAWIHAWMFGAELPKDQAVPHLCLTCEENISIIPDTWYDNFFASEISEPAFLLHPGQLVLARINTNRWEYVIIISRPFQNGHTILAHMCNSHEKTTLETTQLRTLKTYWQWTCQLHTSSSFMHTVLQNFAKTEMSDPVQQAFYQVKILPHNSIIHAIGDLHGDSRSLLSSIKKLYWQNIINIDGIIQPDHFLILLGDYSDRGRQSCDVWNILMMLKKLNPDNVIIIRGNHETLHMAQEHFLTEWIQQFCYNESFHVQQEKLSKLFESLPQAVLLGIPTTPHDSIIEQYKFFLFCHGGIDPTVSFERAICKTIASYKKTGLHEAHNFLLNLRCPEGSGLLWTDFEANNTVDEEARSFLSNRGFGMRTFNTTAVLEYLERHRSHAPEHDYSLDGIVRGHQHLRGGINRLLPVKVNNYSWQPLTPDSTYIQSNPTVYTCTSSPEGLAAVSDLSASEVWGPLEKRPYYSEDSMLTIKYQDQGYWKLIPFIKEYKK